MDNKDIIKAVGEVDDELLERSEKKKHSRAYWRNVTAAACVCVIIGGVAGYAALSRANNAENMAFTASDNMDEAVEAAEDNMVFGAEEINGAIAEDMAMESAGGVTIPKINVELSESDGVMKCWAYRFFIYNGNCYVELDDSTLADDLKGDYVGEVTGMLDIWTPQDGYVDFAGNMTGDIYTVNGYDPDFMLCVPIDGVTCTFINANGISLTNGADFYDSMLKLTGNFDKVQYESYDSWNNALGEIYEIQDAQALDEFVSALNDGEFMYLDDIPDASRDDIYANMQVAHLYIHMNNDLDIHLRLIEGGYIIMDELENVCVNIGDEAYNNLLNVMEKL